MSLYVAKAIRDKGTPIRNPLDDQTGNTRGQIIGYKIQYQTKKHITPRGDYRILEGVDTKYPKAVLQGNEWVVVEDADKKQQVEDKKQQRSDIKGQIIDAIQLIDSAQSVDEIKPILKKLLIFVGRHLS